MSNTGDQHPYYMFNIQDKIVYTQRVDFTPSGQWTKFGHNKVVHQYNIKNLKLTKNQVGKVSSDPLYVSTPSTPSILLYTIWQN